MNTNKRKYDALEQIEDELQNEVHNLQLKRLDSDIKIESLDENHAETEKRLKLGVVWTFRTTHTEPVEVQIDEGLLVLRDISFVNLDQFVEKQTNTVLFSCEICQERKPWQMFFQYLLSGKVEDLLTELNFVHETWILLDFFCPRHPILSSFMDLIQTKFVKNRMRVTDLPIAGFCSYVLFVVSLDEQKVQIERETKQETKINLELDDQKDQETKLHKTNDRQKLFAIWLGPLFGVPQSPEKQVLYTEFQCKLMDYTSEEKLLDWNNPGEPLTKLEHAYWTCLQYYAKSWLAQPCSIFATHGCFVTKLELKHQQLIETECLIFSMITKWLNEKCVWTGGSLVSTLMGQTWKPRSDIDLYVFSLDQFHAILDELQKVYGRYLYILNQKSVWTILIDEACPLQTFGRPLQLMYCDGTQPAASIISNFHMDYVRCFYDGTKVYKFPECQLAHLTKTIRSCQSQLKSDTVRKAKEKQFQFDCQFEETAQHYSTEHSYFEINSTKQSHEYIMHALCLFFPHHTVTWGGENSDDRDGKDKQPEFKASTLFHPYPLHSSIDYQTATPVDLETCLNHNCDSFFHFGPLHTIFNSHLKTCRITPVIHLELKGVVANFGIDNTLDVFHQKPEWPVRLAVSGLSESLLGRFSNLETMMIKSILTDDYMKMNILERCGPDPNRRRQFVVNLFRPLTKTWYSGRNNPPHEPLFAVKVQPDTSIVDGITTQKLKCGQVKHWSTLNLKVHIGKLYISNIEMGLTCKATEIVVFPPNTNIEKIECIAWYKTNRS